MTPEWSPPWIVAFDCGHVRHPEQYGDLSDGPPPNGWGGWCLDCHDYRTTVDVIEAAPLGPGSQTTRCLEVLHEGRTIGPGRSD